MDPENTSGVVQTIKSKIQTTLEDQISNIVKEFSLDKEGSALNRLITEIKKQNAHNDDNFQKEVGKIKDIFSLPLYDFEFDAAIALSDILSAKCSGLNDKCVSWITSCPSPGEGSLDIEVKCP